MRCNPHKLLFDPYARAVGRPFVHSELLFDYDRTSGYSARAEISASDSGDVAPLAAVIDERFDWHNDRPPSVAWEKTVIYEAHVRGTTIRHPLVDAEKQGKFLGLAAPAMIDHLHRLGVTAVELLPVAPVVDELRLVRSGLVNYWGYNPLSFFAPDPRFATAVAAANGPQAAVDEFKTFVRQMHQAGIEVLIDVVFNHTGEGGPGGPTVSLRGFDNAAYYRLDSKDPSSYFDVTGCGNTVRTSHPAGVRLVLDALRYWVLSMHVDGFRFDLGAALARGESGDIDMQSALMKEICSDPVLAQVKLIAEPWDLGPDGYKIGAFPPPFKEWNGRFRDTARKFWRGDSGMVPDLATRISGSSDQFSWNRRPPQAGINFITAHDGFTLNDLTSYSRKHNLLNREQNRDGSDNDGSFNCGEEGMTDRAAVNDLRLRQRMNLAATLCLSSGVPMILAGDEFLRTQMGNNNCYCQDNHLSWIDWNISDEQVKFFDFFSRLISWRKSVPFLRRQSFFSGNLDGSGLKDISWLRPDGSEFAAEDWQPSGNRALGALLSGWGAGPDPAASIPTAPRRASSGEAEKGSPYLFLLNGGAAELEFAFPALLLPIIKRGGRIRTVFDTAKGGFVDSALVLNRCDSYRLLPSSAAALIIER